MPTPFANMPTSVRTLCVAVLAASLGGAVVSAAPRDNRPDRPAEAYAAYGAAHLAIADARAAVRTGNRALARAFWQEAVDHLEKAAAADPTSRDVVTSLFGAYVRLGQNEKAAEALARLARETPDTPAAHRDLARIYKSLGKTRRAREEYQRAIDGAEPGTDRWHRLVAEYALLLRAAGASNQAVELYRKILEHVPDDTDARLGLGYALGEAGRHADSIDTLLPLAGTPDKLPEGEEVRVPFFLAGEYRKADKALEGAQAFARLADQQPDSSEICQARMHLLDAAKRDDDAIAVGEAFLQKHPDASAVQLILADLTGNAGRHERAAQLYRALLNRSPNLRNACARQLIRLADALAAKGKADAALAALKDVLNTQGLGAPVRAQAHMALAALRHRRGQAALALEELKPVLDSPIGRQWPIQVMTAELLDSAGRTGDAVALLRKALDQHAGNARALETLNFTLGTLLLAHGEEESRVAEEHLKRVLVLDPKHAGAANGLGYLYALHNRSLDEAEKLLDMALEQRPGEPAFLDSLGWVYYKQALRDNNARRLAQAIEKLQAAAEKVKDGVIYDHLAEAYFVNGQWEKAVETWKQALAAPETPGQEPLDKNAVRARLKRVRERLADEKRRAGVRSPAQRRGKALKAPDAARDG